MTLEQTEYEEEIRRVEITVTVLAPANAVAGVIAMARTDEGLVRLSERMDTGDLVGTVTVSADVAVPAAEVRQALIAAGNDGSFFSHLRRG